MNDHSFLDNLPDYLRDWEPNIPKKIDKPPPPVEKMREILLHLNERNCFAKRSGIEKDEDDRIIAVGWLECGMALKLAYGDVGFDLWALTHVDQRAYADAPAQWKSLAAEMRPRDVTIGTLIRAAKDAGFVMPGSPGGAVDEGHEDARCAVGEGVTINHFRAYMPLHSYIFMPSREMWPASSIDARFLRLKSVRASQCLPVNGSITCRANDLGSRRANAHP